MYRKRLAALLIGASALISGLAVVTATAPAAHAFCTQEDRDAGNCPGGGGGGGTPTTSPPSTAIPRTLQSFVLTTNSVRAWATISYITQPGEVTVRWGDNTFNTLAGGQIPAGQVTFTHEYAVPMGGGAFPTIVTGQVDNDSDARFITVTPRWTVTQTGTRFRPFEHCDSFAESESEFRVDQKVTKNGLTVLNQRFEKSLHTNNQVLPDDTVAIRLADFNIELTMAEANSWENFNSVEMDPISDDNAASNSIRLDPSLGSRHEMIRSDDCASQIDLDLNVQLIH